MKTRFVIVLVLFFTVLQIACSGESKKESDVKAGAKSIKESKTDTSSAEAKLAKRAQDLQEQADHLALIYCKCTERRSDSTRRTCVERIEKAVTAILTNLKGEEKTAFETKYNEKTAGCKAQKPDKADIPKTGK
ncbi:hypothetical protein C7N43_39260 [Sphingobacteriales bacterium UPWRP_1]|nr:hypothetical protein C7N43_39260 [Sphingobacteriales bacterium UPWRP_1]